MGVIRGSIRLVWFVLMVVTGLFLTGIIFPFAGWDIRRWVVQNWSRALIYAVGVRLVIESPPASERLSGLMVSNHSSWLDIFVTNAVHPIRFVSKSEIRDWPILGFLVTKAGSIYVERGNRMKIDATNQEIANAIAGGDMVGVYPEGTTTDGTYMLAFKTNLIQPVVGQPMSVYPVALVYRQENQISRVASYEGDMSFLAKSVVIGSG